MSVFVFYLKPTLAALVTFILDHYGKLFALKFLCDFAKNEIDEIRSTLNYQEEKIIIDTQTENLRALIELRNEAYGKTLILKNNKNEFIN